MEGITQDAANPTELLQNENRMAVAPRSSKGGVVLQTWLHDGQDQVL